VGSEEGLSTAGTGAQTPLSLDLPELRSHRHWCALLALLAPLFGITGLFQSGIATNEGGGDRTDGAGNEGEEEGVIHAQRQGLLPNTGMQCSYLEMLSCLYNTGGGRVLEVRRRLLGRVAGEDRHPERARDGSGRVRQRGRLGHLLFSDNRDSQRLQWLDKQTQAQAAQDQPELQVCAGGSDGQAREADHGDCDEDGSDYGEHARSDSIVERPAEGQSDSHGQTLRDHDFAGRERGQVFHALEEDRYQEEAGEEHRRGDPEQRVPDGEGIVAEQAQVQHGIGDAQFDQDKGDEQDTPGNERADDGGRTPAIRAGQREAVDQRREARHGQRQAEPINVPGIRRLPGALGRLFLRLAAQHKQRQQKSDGPDGQVDQKNRVPARGGCQVPSECRSSRKIVLEPIRSLR
jgi:hypothetical protein